MLAAASTEKPELPCLGGAEARASGISDVFLCFLQDRRAISSGCESEKGSATAVQGVAAGLTYTNKQTEPSRGEPHSSPVARDGRRRHRLIESPALHDGRRAARESR